jgi:D-amino-acid dehydrogenase
VAVEPEVVVVGGGAVGVTAAYELARRGCAVTLLERGAALGAGCSSGNAGLICPSHSHPLATPAALREGALAFLVHSRTLGLRARPDTIRWLARFAGACRTERAHRGRRAIQGLSTVSLALHAELAALGTGFTRRGIMNVYGRQARLERARHEAAPWGLVHRVLSPPEVRKLEPALTGPIAGAIFFPEEAHLDPVRYVRAVAAAAEAAGAELRTGVEVTALRRRNGAIGVVTADGELRPRMTVLAAGAWTARLARGIGEVMPLTGGKGYHVDLAAAPGDPRVPFLIDGARTAVTPLDGLLRFAGTLTVAGLDESIDRKSVAAIRAAAERLLPAAAGREVVDVWAGLRPCTPDGLPVIGTTASSPGLILATGHAMKGLSLAPVTARLVAELACGQPASHDLAPFSPERFRPEHRRR